MSSPSTSTLVVAGGVSALCFAAAVAFLVHTFSTLPERVVDAPPPRPAPAANPFRPRDPQEVAGQLGLEFAERAPPAGDSELEKFRQEMDKRRARNRSITGPHWEQVLAESTDLGAFMSEVEPVAEQGDASAQFAVYLALSQCRKQMRDALAKPEAKARCATLSRTGLQMKEQAASWLDRSATGNYPRALAQRALDRMAEGVAARISKAERALQLQDAEADLVRALNSDDPAITWLAAHAVSLLHYQDPRAERAMWVWRLAACEQGLPCGDDAPWMLELCMHHRDCRDGESGRNYIRRKSGELASLIARARELAMTLHAGKLDAAQFAATVTSLPEAPPRKKNTAAARTS